MTLRKTTLVIVGMTICGLMAVMYIISQSILFNGFSRIEQSQVQHNIERVSKVFSEQVTFLKMQAKDYSNWDDTCDYLEKGNPRFEINFVSQAMANLKVNFVLVYNREGKLVFSKGEDHLAMQEIPIPDVLLKQFTATGNCFKTVMQKNEISGVLSNSDRPLMVSANPILTSTLKGPSRGVLIFARYLDEGEIRTLVRISDLDLHVHPLNDLKLPEDFHQAMTRISAGESSLIRPLDSRKIAGYVVVKDIYNQPCLMIRLDMSRSITRYGRMILWSYIFFLIGVGVIVGGMTIYLLEKLVISKVICLKEEVTKVNDAGGRIPMSMFDEGENEIFDLAKQINGMLELIDVSKREIFAQQERFRSLVQNTNDIILVLDEKGCINFVTQSVQAILGYQPEDVLGRDVFSYTHPDDSEKVQESLSRLINHTETSHAVYRCRHANGSWSQLDCTGENLVNDPNVRGFVVTCHDVTEQVRNMEALVQARQEAETASAAKGTFLANMSHEIRTPMNGIMGMTELALDSQLLPEQREYLEMVKSSADSLLSILNDVLDFSKIEAGKMDLIPIPFDLRDCLCESVGTLGLRADRKGLELACQIGHDIPDKMIGDPGRLRQIIVNLVGNAIKFTDKGEVVVRVSKEEENGEEIRLHFVVQDTGIGIPAEKQAMIFDAFTQVDSTTTRKHEGTGLGLAISSQLVKMMNGRIWVESECGKGSQFHFVIELGVQKDIAIQEQVFDESLRGLAVLIVDDNRTNRQILSELTERWEMKPVQAAGGEEALLKIAKAADEGHPFPLVLLDTNMPGMDGFTVAEQIKKDPRFSKTAIIMLSSAGRRGDGAKCEQLGIAGYLLKPIKQSDLLQGLMMAMGMSKLPKGQCRLVTRHTIRECRRHLRLLLAEDNPVNQKLAKRILEKWGHTVVVANNGREAIDLLEKTGESFDLVLMDVQMPEMGGYEATGIIREREKVSGGHMPIVAMTAHAMKGDREKTLESGMDDYVSKPINQDVLFDVIETVIAKKDALDEEHKRNNQA
jgi:PAS domain S-box-containing protein